SALRDARRFLESESVDPITKNNNIAMIELVNVYAWANLVDTYGDIPYFGASATINSPGVLSALRDARRFLESESVDPITKNNNIAMIELVNV
ncbi:SusD/RagB family nutrient-binding outer membrane lipoprotein, partial [Chryseobacterium sp. CH1]|uniref:SusD/RagB family nutrient-binding outer membrane lipoprotein n=1 Tax=Chryseobacterium sp. CH1 TaxID=713551 RepID=UPI001E62DED9